MFAAVAAFAAASCAQELDNQVPAGEIVTYEAAVDGADTKAALNERTLKSEWVAGDAITVHDGNKGYTFTTKESGAQVEFSNAENFGSYRPVMAVYPAGTYAADLSSKSVTAYIPTWQQAQVGTYDSGAAVAVAYSETNSFGFKNATALLKFTVDADNVTHVVFHGNNEEPLTGDVKVDLGEEGVKSVTCLETVFTEKQWNDAEQKEDEIKVTKYGTWVECYAYHDDQNKYFVKGETYYIAVAPQKFVDGVTLKIRIDEGEEIVVKSTKDEVETKANTILNLGEIKYVAPVVHEWAVTGTFNDWSTDANPMVKEGDFYVAKNITGLNYTDPATGETGSSTGIKFLNNGNTWRGGEGQVTVGTWAYVWGDGGNIYVKEALAAAAYDIYLNPAEGDYGKFVVVNAGAGMPEDNPVEESEVIVKYWAVVGTMSDWGDYAKLTLSGEWYVATDVELTAADQFKFRADENWDINRGAEGSDDGVLIENNVETNVIGGGKNFRVAENGMYSIYINKFATKVKVVKTGDIPIPTVKNWGLVGSHTNWGEKDDIAMPLVGDWYVATAVEMPAGTEFKFRVDGKWASEGGEELSYAGSVTSGNEYNVSKVASNISITAGAVYDVYLSRDETKMKVIKVGDLKDPAIMAKEGCVYLLPNSNWTQSNAWFAVYLCNGSKNAMWIKMTKVEGTSYYEAELPADFNTSNYMNIIFCRMNAGNTSGLDWGNKWNQTGDLASQNIIDGNNCCAINNGLWDCGTNVQWSNVAKLN